MNLRRWLLLCCLPIACSRSAAVERPLEASVPVEPLPSAAPAASVSASASASASAEAPQLPPRPPLSFPSLVSIDEVVRAAIDRGDVPGAVVVVSHRDQIVYRKAFGFRSKAPVPEPMTVDTVFDLASVTKPVATSASILLLVEQGKLRIEDPVAKYWPEFGSDGKGSITLEHLLLHISGLPAAIGTERVGDSGTQQPRVVGLRATDPPGKIFRYSDAGFIVLGELVRRVSGERLDSFFAHNFAEPLNLKDTAFVPSAELLPRIAPTENRSNRMLRGQDHDFLAAQLGGVAGSAGLFSTAEDLVRFCRMVLHGGELDGKRVLAEDTVREWLRPRLLPKGFRTLGWDFDTGYSGNRGAAFPVGGVGHTGFTGTSIWIDRASQTAVVVLANRVHPEGKGDARRLRSEVATLVGKAVAGPPQGWETLTGLDVLERRGFEELKGRKVGLVTNPSGVDREGKSTIDVLRSAPEVSVVVLFSPEHGLRGNSNALVWDGTDSRSGLPIYSLYGPRKRPELAQLRGADTLVYDMQDVGTRFFTYASTLGHVLETAAEHKLRVFVLDRPDPAGATPIDGPTPDPNSESFTCFHTLPLRYAMTPGELANLLNTERKIGADLHVVRMQGWRHGDPFESTGLRWVRPSPNLPNPLAARLYPGVALLETTQVSVGRGTELPFQVVGAPWIDALRFAAALEDAKLPGVHFIPTWFQPVSSTYAGQSCQGVRILVVDPERLQPARVGVEIARQLVRLYSSEWVRDRLGSLLVNASTLRAIENGESSEEISRRWQQDLRAFSHVRAKYLLY